MADKYRKRLFSLLKSYYKGSLREDYFEDSAEQRFYRKIYFETFRHLGFLENCIDKLCNQTPGPELRSALVLGACQMLFMNDIPDYAAVNETVTLVPQNKRSFVNAVLRNVGRRKEEFLAEYNVRSDFPEWFVKRWEAKLGDDVEEFLTDLNTKPAFYGVDIDTLELQKVEEYNDDLYIMDRASYAIAKVAGDVNPLSILDCCAAPGGKTFILSKTYRDARVFAVEKSERRFENLKDNVANLGLKNVDCLLQDIFELETEAEFDLILLDAPCSALGTIKRHPEVRWFRSEKDIKENARRQFGILKKVSKFLAPGGKIIYSVCSMEDEETVDVVNEFLESNSSFKLVQPVCDDDFQDGDYFRSIPYKNNADGFFGAVLTKIN